MKTCLKCKFQGTDELFKVGRNICKKCYNKDQRERHHKRMSNESHQVHHKERVRRYHLSVKYGLTIEQAEDIYSRGCEICGSTKTLNIDHDHKTGKVRGCLCSKCNRGLGYLCDSVPLLEKAKLYLLNTTES